MVKLIRPIVSDDDKLFNRDFDRWPLIFASEVALNLSALQAGALIVQAKNKSRLCLVIRRPMFAYD